MSDIKPQPQCDCGDANCDCTQPCSCSSVATDSEESDLKILHGSVLECPNETGPSCMCQTTKIEQLNGMLPLNCCGKCITDLPPDTVLENLDGMCACGKGHGFNFSNESGQPVFTEVEFQPMDNRKFRILPCQRD